MGTSQAQMSSRGPRQRRPRSKTNPSGLRRAGARGRGPRGRGAADAGRRRRRGGVPPPASLLSLLPSRPPAAAVLGAGRVRRSLLKIKKDPRALRGASRVLSALPPPPRAAGWLGWVWAAPPEAQWGRGGSRRSQCGNAG